MNARQIADRLTELMAGQRIHAQDLRGLVYLVYRAWHEDNWGQIYDGFIGYSVEDAQALLDLLEENGGYDWRVLSAWEASTDHLDTFENPSW